MFYVDRVDWLVSCEALVNIVVLGFLHEFVECSVSKR